MSLARTDFLAVPSKGRGHRHRRSAAISLDWRHVQMPPLEPPTTTPVARPLSCSPTLTYASTLSDSTLEETEGVAPTVPPLPIPTLSPENGRPKKSVSFVDEVGEIPPREPGDTWMKAEDYSWPTPSSDSKTVLLDPLEPSIDLAPALSHQVPGSPVLMHRKKRSSFLQTTKNALSRRPSKKRPVSPTDRPFDIPIPAPKSSMIDLDLALGPQTSLRHKKSGSLGAFSVLPASPTKPKSWHRRSDSAPADILFSFSPRPASPDSRKRKMSSIVEHPAVPAGAREMVDVRMDPTSDFTSRRTGLQNGITDDMIFGEPGDMVSVQDSVASSDSPAVAALKGNAAGDYLAGKSRKGWKGVLHRLLH